jgi:methionine aminopeptidase
MIVIMTRLKSCRQRQPVRCYVRASSLCICCSVVQSLTRMNVMFCVLYMQFEHTILVTESGYELLTARNDEPVMQWSVDKLQR